jgi:hypothetical protein
MIPSDLAAYHEAGHAVAAAMLNIPVARISIRPDGDEGGRTTIERADFDAAPLEHRIMTLLAGQVGTWMNPAFDGNGTHPGCRGDLDIIYALLGVASVDALADPRWQAASSRLIELFHQDRAERAVHQLATILLEREEVDAYAEVDIAKLLVHLHQ